MEGIELEIILDKPEKTYAGGEKIRGQVKVVVGKEFQSAGLILVLYCKGFSEVKRSTVTMERGKENRTLFNGPWIPGGYTYPFEMAAPVSPFTHKGQILDVTWHLGTRAHSSPGEDATAEVEITIVPEKKISEGARVKSSGEVVHTESARSLKGFFVFSLIVFLTGVIVAWRTSPLVKEEVTGGFIFGGILPTLIGLALLSLTIYQALINKRIKKAEVRIGSRQAGPGDKIPCSVTFEANIPFEVDKVSITLRGEEVVDSGTGKNRTFRKHVLYENKHELPIPVKQVPANVPIEANGEFMVPADAPYSINLMDSDEGMELRWQLEFLIEMKKWPDWRHLETITVQP